MSFFRDLNTAFQIAVGRKRGSTHEERLESFYSGQATGYDDFRRRLLHSRDDMIRAIPVQEGSVWVDLGAGTGENADRIGPAIQSLKQLYLVDITPSLLEIAKLRIKERKWENVQTIEHDATKYVPPEGQVDIVTFSYSLTMIPDWFRAIDHAYSLLKPGGMIGVVDFFVARKYPAADQVRHKWSTRTFWPAWFGSDNVFLSSEHLPYLRNRFETVDLQERRGKVPFMPFVRAPHYYFIGRKPLN